MMNLKTNIGYLVSTLSLGIMLTACGDDKNSSGTHMQIQEGNRQIVSDNNANSFLSCGGGSNYGQQGGQQNYQNNYQSSGEIRIDYQQSHGNNNRYSQQNANQPNDNYENNDWANYNGANTDYNNPNYNYNSGSQNNNGQNYGYSSGVQVSLIISQVPSYNQYGGGSTSQKGSYYASVQISGTQAQVSGQQCSVSDLSNSSQTISGTVVCPSYQGSSVKISFSCQRR